NYDDAQVWRSASAATFSVSAAATNVLNHDELAITLFFKSRGLSREINSLSTMLTKNLESPRFDELDRIGYLVEDYYHDVTNSLADVGRNIMRATSKAANSLQGQFYACTDGMEGLHFVRHLYKQSETKAGLRAIS